jgi:excisionase family DNA binding protein
MKSQDTRIATFLTIEEVADRLRMHQRTIRRLIKSGKLRAHRIGGCIRINVEDLAAFIALTRV